MIGSVDVGSFLSALVGAAAALGGVLITQKSQRRNAHADRIWSARTAAYGALYEIIEADLRVLMGDDVGTLTERGVDVLDSPLPRGSAHQLHLFGSRAVVEGYREYYSAVADVLTAARKGQSTSRAVKTAADSGIRLQHRIREETRGD